MTAIRSFVGTMPRLMGVLLSLMGAGGMLLLFPHSSQGAPAQVYLVTRFDDHFDKVCDQDCSLRDAVWAANLHAGADTISLPSGLYILGITGTDENAAQTGDLDILDDVRIEVGSGYATLQGAGGWDDRIFHLVGSASRLELRRVNVRFGSVKGTSNGGGIFNEDGVLFLDQSSVTQSQASSGGGVYSSGVMTITNSTISNNRARIEGGGVWQGIQPLQVNNATIVNNTSNLSTGGGVKSTSISFNLANSILAGNVSSGQQGPDCDGVVVSGGYNLIQDADQCTLDGNLTGNLVGVDPTLDALQQSNGAYIHEPLPGSPAIDAGNPAEPGGLFPACAAVDQLGHARPVSPYCDIGAVETAKTMQFERDDLRVYEDGEIVTLTVILPNPLPGVARVHYDTQSDRASPGEDFIAAEGTLEFLTGTLSLPISISILDDARIEPNETFTVTLSVPENAELGSLYQAGVTIIDDDAKPGHAFQLSRSWESIPLPAGITTGTITSLAVHPLDAYSIFLATSAGLFQSHDGGVQWSRVASTTLNNVIDVAISTADPERVFAQSFNLYRSDNGGETWQNLGLQPGRCGLALAASDPDWLYSRRCGAGVAVYRSENAGQSWITPSVDFLGQVFGLAVSPADKNVLIASQLNRVLRSGDGGATWQEMELPVEEYRYPVFDPMPPHILYLYGSLYRSLDGGQTWNKAQATAMFDAMTPSPFTRDEILAGDEGSSWRIRSAQSDWRAYPWDAPLPLKKLWRSAQDARLVYALSRQGLWRYEPAYLGSNNSRYLPMVWGAAQLPAFPLASSLAVEGANAFRQAAGMAPLHIHPSIIAAAANHADYYVTNTVSGNTAAFNLGVQGEVAGQPGYTGQWPIDRMRAQGYPWWGGVEMVNFVADPAGSIDSWINSIYHRSILLDPDMNLAGYANLQGPAGYENVKVDVMDLGYGQAEAGPWLAARPMPFVYPWDSQAGVPTSWTPVELPSPLPPGVDGPVGYPITLVGFGGILAVENTSVAITGPEGALARFPNPITCVALNCYAIIPQQPLAAGTTYSVHIEGAVSGFPFTLEWSFTTAGP